MSDVSGNAIMRWFSEILASNF